MTESENKELSRLATAVESLGTKVADINGGLRAIGQWMDDREKDHDRYERQISSLEAAIGDQRDRITKGLTWQSLLPATLSTLVTAAAVGIPLWLKVRAAIEKIGG